MTSRPTFEVQAQRSDGRCYVNCETHRATSFAVIEIKKWSKTLSGGKRRNFTARRVIARFPTMNKAKLEAAAMTRRYEPLGLYKLGQRIVKELTNVG